MAGSDLIRQAVLFAVEHTSIELTTAVGKASEDIAKSARRHVTAVATELDDMMVSMQATLRERLAALEADCVGLMGVAGGHR
jgi:hypothetical protein